METPILGAAQADLHHAQTWAEGRGATPTFVLIAELYWRYAPERGVRPEVAYAQAAKETGFGNFGGVIDRSYRNWCGLKTSEGGANGDPAAHMRFPTDDVGVVAHIDHLALYAAAPGYPRGDSPDPRHFASIADDPVETVEELGGRWAPSGQYGRSIVDSYLTDLLDR